MTHPLKLEAYKDYDQLYHIIDTLDQAYPHAFDLSVYEAVAIVLSHFPLWAICDMVTTPYTGTDWQEASLFNSVLKAEAARVYPKNTAFK